MTVEDLRRDEKNARGQSRNDKTTLSNEQQEEQGQQIDRVQQTQNNKIIARRKNQSLEDGATVKVKVENQPEIDDRDGRMTREDRGKIATDAVHRQWSDPSLESGGKLSSSVKNHIEIDVSKGQDVCEENQAQVQDYQESRITVIVKNEIARMRDARPQGSDLRVSEKS